MQRNVCANTILVFIFAAASIACSSQGDVESPAEIVVLADTGGPPDVVGPRIADEGGVGDLEPATPDSSPPGPDGEVPLECEPGEWFEENGDCVLCAADGRSYQGEPLPLDDGNVCTFDECNADQGVVHTPQKTGPCDDGDEMTIDDMCVDGACVGVPIICPAQEFFVSDGACALCNEDGTQLVDDGTPLEDGNVCTADVCDPAAGLSHPPQAGPCDDGNAQTLYDSCEDGNCVGVPVLCDAGEYFAAEGVCYLCNQDGTGLEGNGAAMDDSNVCTADLCDPAAGLQHPAAPGPCDDGNAQTLYDSCQGTVCVGVPIVCAAGEYFAANGKCQLCSADGTELVGPGVALDDGNVCTADSCHPAQGILHEPAPGPCTDDNAQTLYDTCQAGACVGVPIICKAGEHFPKEGVCLECSSDGTQLAGDGIVIDDGNICTSDVCNADLGVVHEPVPAPCDDGDPETLYDSCQNGQCAGIPVICLPGEYFADAGLCLLCSADGTQLVGQGQEMDDGNICTADHCKAETGVVHEPHAGPCDDGDPQTQHDTCSQGVCAGMPILCPAGEFFDHDGECTLCSNDGTIITQIAQPIDDGTVCTADACDPQLGAQHEPVDGPCDDGNPWTVDDQCLDGYCLGQGTGPVSCPPGQWVETEPWWCRQCNATGDAWVDAGHPVNDHENCTLDSCHPELGVVNEPLQGWCTDFSECTLQDKCVDGVCTGVPVHCDDGSQCTSEYCDPAVGCVYTVLDNVPCDDGVALTPDDTCIDGTCVGWIDPDKDGIPNYGPKVLCDGPDLTEDCLDNCRFRANPGQADLDDNDVGDTCQWVRWWMRIDTEYPVVAVTLDDGYYDVAMNAILDTLVEKKAYASFFLAGSYLDSWVLPTYTLDRIRYGGHYFGNHSYHHQHLNDFDEAVAEIEYAATFWEGLYGDSLRPAYRPPYAEHDMWLHDAFGKTRYTEVFLGSFDAYDWVDGKEPDPAELADCIVSQTQAGEIIVLHVGPMATVEALPLIIDGLRAKGFELLTVEQIVAFGWPILITESEVKDCEHLLPQ